MIRKRKKGTKYWGLGVRGFKEVEGETLRGGRGLAVPLSWGRKGEIKDDQR